MNHNSNIDYFSNKNESCVYYLKLNANIKKFKKQILILEEDRTQLNILKKTLNRLEINNFTISTECKESIGIIFINQIKFPIIKINNRLHGSSYKKIAFENKLKHSDIVFFCELFFKYANCISRYVQQEEYFKLFVHKNIQTINDETIDKIISILDEKIKKHNDKIEQTLSKIQSFIMD